MIKKYKFRVERLEFKRINKMKFSGPNSPTVAKTSMKLMPSPSAEINQTKKIMRNFFQKLIIFYYKSASYI